MKRFVLGAASLLALAWAGLAEARNPHCAGGIQYWQQWRNDKEKKNFEDYQRELMKSIQQLEMCSAEDPKDFEAIGYLGWCYAEADSAAAAGRAFAAAIEGLKAKGDPKGVDRVVTNRESFWAAAFNDGIAKIKGAQDFYPDFCKKPESKADEAQKALAAKKYDEAIASLDRAALYKPGESRTLRNLGTIHALRCDYIKAEAVFREAQKLAPADTDIVNSLRGVRTNIASQLIEDKKYDEAIGFYVDLVKGSPQDANLRIGLADAYFRRAGNRDGADRKSDFKVAGDNYAAGAELKASDPDLPFNAALAFQNAGEFGPAETWWRQALKLRPSDPQALSALGSVLAEVKKFDEGIKVLHQAVVAEPKDKSLHRQLGAVYTKAGNNQKATEELMVFLALQNGQAVADPLAAAKLAPAGSQAAKTLATVGVPEQLYAWTAESDKYESWFYWSKRVAYHFKGGAVAQKSDWSVADLTSPAGGRDSKATGNPK